MGHKILNGVKMGRSWTSYIGAAYGVLRGAGLWEDSIENLLGMTGMGFHFIVHRQTCPSSVTVYDWVSEHFAALDRIGVFSEGCQVSCLQALNTLSQVRETAIRRIKESIDRGVGVVVWAPTPTLEFGIIYGYDDADGIFYVEGCGGPQVDPLCFVNLGKSEIPILYFQIIEAGKVGVEPGQVYRASLEFAVGEWRKPFHIHPDYASGAGGYQNLCDALAKNDFNDFGLAYILAVYGDAKKGIAQYLDFLAQSWSQTGELARAALAQAAQEFQQVARLFETATALIPFSGQNGFGCTIDRTRIPETLRLMQEAWKLEENAFRRIEKTVI